jgi:hypothetical protein
MHFLEAAMTASIQAEISEDIEIATQVRATRT